VRVTAIILAAGASSRMGSEPKQLLPVGGRPMAQRAIDAALASRAHEVLLVVGASAGAVTSQLELGDARVILNTRYRGGRNTSMDAGLRECDPETDAVVFLQADQPFVDERLVDALIGEMEATGAATAAVRCGEEVATPFLFARRVFGELSALGPEEGGCAVISAHRAEAVFVDVDDPMLVANVDTPEDYRAIEDAAAAMAGRRVSGE